MATPEALGEAIAQQSALLVDLRKQQADNAIIEEAKKKLGELKKAQGQLLSAGGSKESGKKKERLLLKTAKVRRVSYDNVLKLKAHGRSVLYIREHATMARERCSVASTLSG